MKIQEPFWNFTVLWGGGAGSTGFWTPSFSLMLSCQFSTSHTTQKMGKIIDTLYKGKLMHTVCSSVWQSRTLRCAVPRFVPTCFTSPHICGPSLNTISKHSRFVSNHEQQRVYGRLIERCKDSEVLNIKRHRFFFTYPCKNQWFINLIRSVLHLNAFLIHTGYQWLKDCVCPGTHTLCAGCSPPHTPNPSTLPPTPSPHSRGNPGTLPSWASHFQISI